MFVQSTTSGTFEPGGAGSFVLTLTNPASIVTAFTDRPERQASTMSAQAFLDQWASFGFSSVPPNAAIVVYDAPPDKDTIVVELSEPRWMGDSIRYTARAVGESAATFASHESDGELPRTFGSASLFIDGGNSNQYQHVTLEVAGAEPGEAIGIEVSGQSGARVAWSLGPVFDDTAGAKVTSQPPGVLPVSDIQISSSQVTFLTSDSGGGTGSVSFSVQLYLVASSGTELFYLRSSSDPGVQVTATFGEGTAQNIDSTETTFAWNGG